MVDVEGGQVVVAALNHEANLTVVDKGEGLAKCHLSWNTNSKSALLIGDTEGKLKNNGNTLDPKPMWPFD